ncbi:MAG: hypothetical protein H0X51_03300 [Parachlamydiaceae bacterium]|nr:hypothetical protein [Parachlamydiaceae bacterium]
MTTVRFSPAFAGPLYQPLRLRALNTQLRTRIQRVAQNFVPARQNSSSHFSSKPLSSEKSITPVAMSRIGTAQNSLESDESEKSMSRQIRKDLDDTRTKEVLGKLKRAQRDYQTNLGEALAMPDVRKSLVGNATIGADHALLTDLFSALRINYLDPSVPVSTAKAVIINLADLSLQQPSYAKKIIEWAFCFEDNHSYSVQLLHTLPFHTLSIIVQQLVTEAQKTPQSLPKVFKFLNAIATNLNFPRFFGQLRPQTAALVITSLANLCLKDSNYGCALLLNCLTCYPLERPPYKSLYEAIPIETSAALINSFAKTSTYTAFLGNVLEELLRCIPSNDSRYNELCYIVYGTTTPWLDYPSFTITPE